MLIYRRNAIFGGAKWKNPYATDGLFAMWDGIWNAGGGIHDPNATVWKDVVSGINIVPTTLTMTFNSDHVNCGGDNTCRARADKACLPTSCNEYTEEVVYRWNSLPFNDGSINNFYIGSSNNTAQAMFRLRIQVKAYLRWDANNWATSQDYISAGAGVTRFSAVVKDAEGFSTYNQNGALSLRTSSVKAVPDGDRRLTFVTGNVDWFAYRLYSRALTAEEIAAHCAIDKARFNLT